MKREDISKLFPDATSEQISTLLNINSTDIGKAKGDFAQLEADLQTASADLMAAKGTISTLEASKGDAAALQKEIDDYKAADLKRTQDTQAAADQAALTVPAARQRRLTLCPP